jgi:hypothetical protein
MSKSFSLGAQRKVHQLLFLSLCMSNDDRKPFFATEYDSVQDAHPEVESVNIRGELRDIVGDHLQTYHFSEGDLPTQIVCENCDTTIRFGWELEDAIDEREEEIEIYVRCPGEEYEGRTCVYGLQMEGTISYLDD